MIEIDAAEIEILASQGMTYEQIASSLGISEDTLARRRKENAEFAESIKKGRARGIKDVTCLVPQFSGAC